MSRKVKTFFHVFLRSLFPHSGYYSKVIKVPFSFSFKYFLMILFVFNACFVLYLVAKYNPAKINSIISATSSSLSNYPDYLTISLKKGRLITNNNHPYFLWLDYQDKKNLFLVIDESANPKKIQLYKSSFLLTAQELVINDTRTNTYSSFPLTYVDDQKITKEKINQLVQIIDRFHSLFPLLFISGFLLLVVFVPFSSLIVTFIYLFFSSVIVFLVFKFFLQKHFHFRKIFQVSFHAITFPLLLDYAVIMINPTIRINSALFLPLRQVPFPMLFLIILAVFVAVGVYEAHTKEHEEKTHHVPAASTRLHHRKKH